MKLAIAVWPFLYYAKIRDRGAVPNLRETLLKLKPLIEDRIASSVDHADLEVGTGNKQQKGKGKICQ
jgi:hypothetical protein